jgi:hypothetical protein
VKNVRYSPQKGHQDSLAPAFFLSAKFRQNANLKKKKNILSQIFLIFEKNRQQSRGFELVSADSEALLLWVAK